MSGRRHAGGFRRRSLCQRHRSGRGHERDRLVYQPDPPTSSAYDGLFEIYRQLYPRLRETFVQLHDLVKTDAAASI